jgi:hypothetical protein
MSRAFIPSFARRRRRAPEAVIAAPEIEPLEWTARKKKQCKLVNFKDADGKPLCEEMFYPKGNQRTCSQKCSDLLAEFTFKATQRRSKKKNRAKITAKQREFRAANRAGVNAKQRDYRRRSGYNEKQQAYRAKKRKLLTCTDCGKEFPKRSGQLSILSNLCADCREKPCHVEAYRKDAKARHAVASRKSRKKIAKG